MNDATTPIPADATPAEAARIAKADYHKLIRAQFANLEQLKSFGMTGYRGVGPLAQIASDEDAEYWCVYGVLASGSVDTLRQYDLFTDAVDLVNTLTEMVAS